MYLYYIQIIIVVAITIIIILWFKFSTEAMLNDFPEMFHNIIRIGNEKWYLIDHECDYLPQ